MIELKNIQAGYEDAEEKNVLKVEAADFEEGEITGIVGLNGSGKSTLLKTILGMTSISSGTVLIDGKKLKLLGHKGRACEIAYLPQSYMTANMDVFTLVSHGRFPYLGFSKILGHKDIELIENALRLTDLWDLRDKKLFEISGGQRQRAYLAMVIAQNTKYILLDEPVSALDVKHQVDFLKLLKKLALDGRGIVITSHDLPQAFSVCSKICLMKNGSITAEGTSEKLASGSQLSLVMGIGLHPSDSADAVYNYYLFR